MLLALTEACPPSPAALTFALPAGSGVDGGLGEKEHVLPLGGLGKVVGGPAGGVGRETGGGGGVSQTARPAVLLALTDACPPPPAALVFALPAGSGVDGGLGEEEHVCPVAARARAAFWRAELAGSALSTTPPPRAPARANRPARPASLDGLFTRKSRNMFPFLLTDGPGRRLRP